MKTAQGAVFSRYGLGFREKQKHTKANSFKGSTLLIERDTPKSAHETGIF